MIESFYIACSKLYLKPNRYYSPLHRLQRLYRGLPKILSDNQISSLFNFKIASQ